MFVSDRIVLLQLQKTGGTHIAALLSDVVGGEQHLKHSRIPDPEFAADRTVVGTMRNPWDWYVSLWAYGCQGGGSLHHDTIGRRWREAIGIDLARRFPLRDSATLSEMRKPVRAWRETYADAHDPGLFRTWLRMICDHERRYDIGRGWVGERGQEYGTSSISTLAGLMTFRYVNLFTADPQGVERQGGFESMDQLGAYIDEHSVLDDVIRMESLEADTIRVLRAAGHDVSDADEARIVQARTSRTNTSDRHEAAFYYDAETADLVARRERLIVEQYGYRPPT